MAAPVSTNISACVNSTTGAVRIVASTSLCVAGETGMAWALVGPTGLKGRPAQPEPRAPREPRALPEQPDRLVSPARLGLQALPPLVCCIQRRED